MANKEWTVEDLIRWRVKDLKQRTPRHVVEMLSVENLDDSKVPLAAVSAVRRFRRLNEAARLRRTTMVLHRHTLRRQRTTPPDLDDLRAHLSELLHDLVLPGNREDTRTVVLAIEELIEAKLTLLVDEARFKLLGQPAVVGAPANTFWWKKIGHNRQCLWGTITVGEARHVGNGLYEAVLGTTRLAGVHPIDVASRRVEQAFLDAANAVVNG